MKEEEEEEDMDVNGYVNSFKYDPNLSVAEINSTLAGLDIKNDISYTSYVEDPAESRICIHCGEEFFGTTPLDDSLMLHIRMCDQQFSLPIIVVASVELVRRPSGYFNQYRTVASGNVTITPTAAHFNTITTKVSDATKNFGP